MLDDVIALRVQLRFLGEPAHHRVEVLRDERPVLWAADHASAGEVDVVGELNGHGLARERLLQPGTARPPHRRHGRGLPRGQDGDPVAGLDHSPGDGPGIPTEVVEPSVAGGVWPDDVLHGQSHVDEVAVGGDMQGFELV